MTGRHHLPVNRHRARSWLLAVVSAATVIASALYGYVVIGMHMLGSAPW